MNENKFQVDTLVSLLREARLRVTRQRLAVLRALAAGAHLATCQVIRKRAQASCDDLGLVTVYRTLARLHASGLVEQIDRDGVAYFGLANRHHDHAICRQCGTVEAMDACFLGAFEGVRLGGSGFLVTGHRLDLFGMCRACQEAK